MGQYTAVCQQRARDNGWTLCSWDKVCGPLNSVIQDYCDATSKTPGTPVPQIVDGKICYCCCSCFAWDTPIEVTPGGYALIQDIHEGDSVLTAGPDLEWKETIVDFATQLGPDLHFDNLHKVTYRYPDADEELRWILVTTDHLFMLDSKKLKPVQALIPGDQLLRADGATAEVTHIELTAYTGGLAHIYSGEFNPEHPNLDGHLLNSNGVVCADYIVQLAFSSGDFHPDLMEPGPDGDVHEVGTDAYEERFGHKIRAGAQNALRASASVAAIRTKQDDDSFRPPLNTHRFFTEKQANDLRKAPSSSPSNEVPMQAVYYVFNMAKGFFPAVDHFVLEWDNKEVNGYSYVRANESWVVITGGLARVDGLNQFGLSLIVANLVGYQYGDKSVGEADYNGMLIRMRQMWLDDLYATAAIPAMEQMKNLFSHVKADHCGSSTDGNRHIPSLECREETYAAGAGFRPIPECTQPGTEFGVKDARAGTVLKRVIVRFTRELDIPTAETLANYTIDSGVVLTDAYTAKQPRSVVLVVEGLEAESTYELTVSNVLSEKGFTLNQDKNTATFETP